ncbi:MAG TPA: hypothetical protein VEF35_07505 [Candidatus Bathyarchaeia archaeon]|nr:hypothetical protein [Candidatus Bathyarchaeia archaeon]
MNQQHGALRARYKHHLKRAPEWNFYIRKTMGQTEIPSSPISEKQKGELGQRKQQEEG